MPASPLFNKHLEHQACFTTVNDWQMPQHYGNPQAEYRALRRGFGLIDLSNRGLDPRRGPRPATLPERHVVQ